jgi:hypothetical protein
MNILNDNGKYTFYNSLKIEDKLETKNYIFNCDEYGNCWLEDAESFKVPEKIYDISSGFRQDVLKSFNHYQRNLGVLLTGNKGQGKSLTAKLLCREMNMPIIIINKSIPKSVNFVRFFNNIKQNHCIFLDEFEKLFSTYSATNENEFHGQEVFLSFMDGVLTNEHKTLFLLTTNDSVNEYFMNRPSRIKFLKEYDELDEEIFNMIVEDKLQNKEFQKDLEDSVSLVNLNIDLLISIIDDINLFNRPFSEFKDNYNYKLENFKYEVSIVQDKSEKFEGYYSSKRKVRNTDTYLHHHQVTDFLKFTREEIIFTSFEWDEDEHGNEIKKDIVVRMTLCSNKYTVTNAYS